MIRLRLQNLLIGIQRGTCLTGIELLCRPLHQAIHVDRFLYRRRDKGLGMERTGSCGQYQQRDNPQPAYQYATPGGGLSPAF
jgi:hypothetical protein